MTTTLLADDHFETVGESGLDDRNRVTLSKAVEQRTAAAYRIFWHDGPGQRQITILATTAHP